MGAYAPGADQGYSPGPSLAPLDHRRSSGWLGPLVAVAVLAMIIAAVAVAFTKVRGGDHNPAQQSALAAPAQTSTAQAVQHAQATASAPAVTPTVKTAALEATKAPTDSPKATETPKPETAVPAAGSANSFLPAVQAVGPGFAVTENSTRDLAGVANSFADPNDATTKLKDWGWKENAYATYEIPAANVTDQTATTYVSVSIHRFSSNSGTTSAFGYFSDALVSGQGMTDAPVDKIGDQTRLLKSSSAQGNLVVLYIRKGKYLTKIAATSPTGDPTADAIAVARMIIG